MNTEEFYEMISRGINKWKMMIIVIFVAIQSSMGTRLLSGIIIGANSVTHTVHGMKQFEDISKNIFF